MPNHKEGLCHGHCLIRLHVSWNLSLDVHRAGTWATSAENVPFAGAGVEIYILWGCTCNHSFKSAALMHANATPTWEGTICWTKMVRCQLAREIFLPLRPSIGLTGSYVGPRDRLSAWKGPRLPWGVLMLVWEVWEGHFEVNKGSFQDDKGPVSD